MTNTFSIGLQYPPGPSGKTVIGNTDLVASLYDRDIFEAWKKQYGMNLNHQFIYLHNQSAF